ncbi:mirror-image polydactyly gene 1 protein isoform 2-T4 [Aulostomus maculatus]
MMSKELQDSLVDMYTANPRVNEELRQRLPSPGRQQLSNTDRSSTRLKLDSPNLPQVPRPLQEALKPCSTFPLSHKRSATPVAPLCQWRSWSKLSTQPPGGGGEMEVELIPSRGCSPHAERSVNGSNGGMPSQGPESPPLQGHCCSPSNSRQDAWAPGRPAECDKNVSLLLKELDALRDINTKLHQQLIHKEEELLKAEVEQTLWEERKEALSWERQAAVLDEVLSAQKDRDQSVMSRLLLANEERDEALLRVSHLQRAAEWDTRTPGHEDLEVDELLQCICGADSVQEVQHFGAALVQRLQLARQRRSDITAQEMKAVMEERDGSAAKSKQLEHDLMQEREQRVSKEELLRLQCERDAAVGDRWRLEAELQVLQASHSSQRLLTPPASFPVDGGCLQSSLLAPPPQAPPLLEQLSKEKHSMEVELQRCQEAEKEASERVRRLERLVDVLRKKVGAGNLRAVI